MTNYWTFQAWKKQFLALHFLNSENPTNETSIINYCDRHGSILTFLSGLFSVASGFLSFYFQQKNDCPESTLIIHHVDFSGADNVIAERTWIATAIWIDGVYNTQLCYILMFCIPVSS